MSWAEVKYLQENSGGLVPNGLKSLLTNKGKLYWMAAQTVVENQTICDVGKIVFRYSKDGFPATPNDGELLLETKELSGSYELSLDDGIYISGFVYSGRNVLNANPTTTTTGGSFDSLDWYTINVMANNGALKSFFSVGDTKTISINGTNYQAVILDFDHDDLSDGSGKAGVTIGLKNCLTTTHAMNSSGTNAGGWESSGMRSWLQSTVWGWLPSDLQSVIKKVDKKATAGSQSTSITTSSDTLFLLSEIEIFGSTSYSGSGEGTQYPYFATSTNRVKKSGDSGSAAYWWERSPYTSTSSYFCSVYSDGGADYDYANSSNGVSFSFCI